MAKRSNLDARRVAGPQQQSDTRLMAIQNSAEIRRAIEQLELKWKVTFNKSETEATCRIVSSPKNGHEITLPIKALEDPETFLPDVMHELCHAHLAEKSDPIFAQFAFTKDSPERLGSMENFQRVANLLYLAAAHVDVWVDDLRHKLWPQLTESDFTSFAQSVQQMGKTTEGQMRLKDPTSLVVLAVNLAEIRRHNVKSAPKNLFLLKTLGLDSMVLPLSEYYEKLPPLSGVKEQDLAMYDASVQDVIKLMRLPIKAQLVSDSDSWVWRVEVEEVK